MRAVADLRLPIRRVLLLLAVASAAAAPGCDFDESGPDPGPNEFFAGCFTGPITEPPVDPDAEVTLVVEEPGFLEQLTLTGCLQLVSGGSAKVQALSGAVRMDDPTIADLTAIIDGQPVDLTVTRSPAGDVDAATVTLDAATAAAATAFGFARAEDLVRCDPERTCADLEAATLPFLPGS